MSAQIGKSARLIIPPTFKQCRNHFLSLILYSSYPSYFDLDCSSFLDQRSDSLMEVLVHVEDSPVQDFLWLHVRVNEGADLIDQSITRK